MLESWPTYSESTELPSGNLAGCQSSSCLASVGAKSPECKSTGFGRDPLIPLQPEVGGDASLESELPGQWVVLSFGFFLTERFGRYRAAGCT